MPAEVVRISDYERRSREADAAGPRDPAEADAIIVRFPRPHPSATEMTALLMDFYGEAYFAALAKSFGM